MTGNVVYFMRGQTEKTLDQIVDLDRLADGELIRLMVEVLDEVKRRAKGLVQHSQRDNEGRLWAMPAIMRAVQIRINHITAILGGGWVK